LAAYKLVTLYQQPPNAAAFDKHFMEVYLPKLPLVPGFRQLVVNRGRPLPWGGDPPYYVLTEMHFRNRVALNRWLWIVGPNASTNRTLHRNSPSIAVKFCH
jgi:uncharacterized protein (TIGR02118 family)